MKKSCLCICLLLLSFSRESYACQAGFTFTVKQGKVSFINTSTGTGTLSYKWNFGDSTIDLYPSPNHYFNAPGKYAVSLTAVQTSPTCSSTFTDTVTIGSLNCQSLFSRTISGQNVLVKNLSPDTANKSSSVYYHLSDNNNFYWSGQGFDTTTLHYQIKGNYKVCLTISDSFCISTNCDSIHITSGPACQATFQYYPIAAPSKTFSFIATAHVSNYDQTKFLWDFGDGIHSSNQYQQHGFPSSGKYNVCLTMTDTLTGCSSKICDTVNSPGKEPCAAKFNSYTQQGANTVFSAAFTAGAHLYTGSYWNYGDGTNGVQNYHHYTSGGKYNTCCTLTDTNTFCVVQVCDSVNVKSTDKCLPYFTYTEGFWCSFQFSNGVSDTSKTAKYFWDFWDSTNLTGVNPIHFFPKYMMTPINYKVCLTRRDSVTGCNDSICKMITCHCIPEGVQEFSGSTTEITELNLFPVPFTDELIVKYGLSRNTQMLITVFDYLGQRMYERSMGT
ncbi:MAG: PKD domain-containing protein, partial [Bacteroidia bacterium]